MIKIHVDNHLDPFTGVPTKGKTVSVEITKDPILGLNWIIDPILADNLIYCVDMESVTIENGIVKFKGKYVKLCNENKREKQEAEVEK